jgi:hypothetical protein
MAWVVRAGEAKAPDLMRGYREHAQVAGLFGFSVQYAPGQSIDQLALSGRFPHAMISYEDDTVLAHAVELVGYRMRLIKSPGHGHHHTFCVIEDLSGQAQTTLPAMVADALARAFRQRANPSRRQP